MRRVGMNTYHDRLAQSDEPRCWAGLSADWCLHVAVDRLGLCHRHAWELLPPVPPGAPWGPERFDP